MARTPLAVQPIEIAGLEPVYTNANADGHSIANDGRRFLIVDNGSGGSINVTVQTPVTVNGRAVADDVVAVPAGEVRFIGPFPPAVHNQSGANANQVWVDFSAVTTVTVAAVSLPSVT